MNKLYISLLKAKWIHPAIRIWISKRVLSALTSVDIIYINFAFQDVSCNIDNTTHGWKCQNSFVVALKFQTCMFSLVCFCFAIKLPVNREINSHRMRWDISINLLYLKLNPIVRGHSNVIEFKDNKDLYRNM